MKDFYFRLLKKMFLYDNSANFIISPFSLFSVFAMLLDGARGETKAEIQRIFGGKDELAMLKVLLERWSVERKILIASANSLWVDLCLQLLPEYEKGLREFGEDVVQRDDF